ncbi:hypothetical protein BDN72DRAFT_789463 [Pluteus cervinus]|uniref:Uncharacterized protein n=1 Tax=Pluteus cervinus TaxID=181527 RepID=A0ACD3B7G5_9AGAR|nr:hypothetical protein BDN72DRAFT_789463 [Pluteus cervinus]
MALCRLLAYALFSTSIVLASALPREIAVRQTTAGGYGNPGYGGPPVNPTSTPQALPVPSSVAAGATNGDSKCGSTMCITATVLNSTVEYTLASSQQPAWMAMGWGTGMVGSHLVVMWANDDGNITVSQRYATDHVMPLVEPNPPKVATLEPASFASSASTKFIFTVPSDGSTTQDVIYAFGKTKPSSSQPDATIIQHVDQGTFTLDLSKSLANNGNPAPPTSPGHTPLDSRRQLIIVHATFVFLGFLVTLPAGALLARYTRTFSSSWFQGHWKLQFIVAGFFIVIGVALGITSVAQGSGRHLKTTHTMWGVILLVLYILQLSLGAFIHFKKDPNSRRRPPQNYGHAVLGLLIIATAFYQVHTGYTEEYPNTFGVPVPGAINVVWYIWVVLLPLLYAGGLAYLPRQFRMEASKLRSNTSTEEMSYLSRKSTK